MFTYDVSFHREEFHFMKATFYFRGYLDGKSDERSFLKTMAGYLLPDSFPRWGWVMFLCCMSSWGGLILAQTPAQADILWPTNGLLIAFLLRMPRRYWVSYLAGSILSNLLV